MDSKKKKIIIAVIVIVILGAVIAVAAQQKKSSSKNESAAVTENETETVSQTESTTEGSSEESSEAATTKETASADESQSDDSSDSGKDEKDTKESSNNGTDTSDDNNSGNTDNTSVSSEFTGFPYSDAASGLSVLKISKYQGIFLEDGSDETTSNVAVIVLRNDSDEDIEYAEITIKKGKKTYHFHASAIKAGALVVVQDVDGKKFKKGTDKSCDIIASAGTTFEMSSDSVKVTETDDDELKVKNLTNEDIPCVRVFYKFYSEDDEAYVGGIAYTAKIEDLKAGDTVKVSPSHYMSGYSQVVMVRTYDSAED